jgi:hypothetical protein
MTVHGVTLRATCFPKWLLFLKKKKKKDWLPTPGDCIFAFTTPLLPEQSYLCYPLMSVHHIRCP